MTTPLSTLVLHEVNVQTKTHRAAATAATCFGRHLLTTMCLSFITNEFDETSEKSSKHLLPTENIA